MARGKTTQQVTCHNCGKLGHKQSDCRSPKNFANGQKGGQQNQAKNPATPPFGAAPHTTCYLHHKGHTNAQCNNPDNKFSNTITSTGQNTTTQKPYVAPNVSSSAKTATMMITEALQQVRRPGNEKYCPRCNHAGHAANECTAPLPANTFLYCQVCGNHGHVHQDCKHPNVCFKCRAPGHTTAMCSRDGGPQEKLRLWVLEANKDAIKELPKCDYVKNWIVNNPDIMAGRSQSARGFGWPTVPTFPATQAPKPNTTWFQISNVCPQEQRRLQQVAEYEKRVQDHWRAAVTKKVANAKVHYKGHSLNDRMRELGGLLYPQGIDGPLNTSLRPQQRKTLGQEGLALLQYLVEHGKFRDMHIALGNGWTFWRDPNALEAIVRKQVPVCNGCNCQGVFRDCTLEVIPRDVDLLDVLDAEDWGVSILFECSCCTRNGFIYENRADPNEMDIDERWRRW